MSGPPTTNSPFNPGQIGAGDAGAEAVTTRFWWVRHAPVAHDGRIYGQKDMPCDCTDDAVFAGLARQLPKNSVWVTSNLRRTHETARAIIRAGLPGPAQIPGPEAGLAKVTIVNGAIHAGELIADVVGPDALAEDSEWAYMISFLPGLKSAGGTEEILRNTIGERVLGLPPEPRLDKGIPFSELRAKEAAKA